MEWPPPGVVISTGWTFCAMVRRVTTISPSTTAADRLSASSSGSFISQWARRRSSSACGPPPSKPRAQSQIWSDISSATRPFFTWSSTSNGLLPGPLITVWPPMLLAPIRRNQRPQLGCGSLSVLLPGKIARHRMGQACRRHHRLERLGEDLAGRLGRQHAGQRRAVKALVLGEFGSGRHQQRAAICRHNWRYSRNRPWAECPPRHSGRRSPDRRNEASRRNNSRVGKVISESSSIGVASCLSGGLQDGEMHQIHRRIGLEQIAPDPFAGMRLARDQQHAQPVAHAGDGDHSAIVLQGQFRRARAPPAISTIFSPSWVTGTLMLVSWPTGTTAAAQGLAVHRQCHFGSAVAAPPKSSTRSTICARLADNGEALGVHHRQLAVALAMIARDQHLQRRLEGSGLARRVMHFAVGDHDGARDPAGRHVGQRIVQGGESLGAVILARGRWW